MDVQALELALCRLASQHHLSEYNQMKRGVSTPPAPPPPSVQPQTAANGHALHRTDSTAPRAQHHTVNHAHAQAASPPPPQPGPNRYAVQTGPNVRGRGGSVRGGSRGGRGDPFAPADLHGRDDKDSDTIYSLNYRQSPRAIRHPADPDKKPTMRPARQPLTETSLHTHAARQHTAPQHTARPRTAQLASTFHAMPNIYAATSSVVRSLSQGTQANPALIASSGHLAPTAAGSALHEPTRTMKTLNEAAAADVLLSLTTVESSAKPSGILQGCAPAPAMLPLQSKIPAAVVESPSEGAGQGAGQPIPIPENHDFATANGNFDDSGVMLEDRPDVRKDTSVDSISTAMTTPSLSMSMTSAPSSLSGSPSCEKALFMELYADALQGGPLVKPGPKIPQAFLGESMLDVADTISQTPPYVRRAGAEQARQPEAVPNPSDEAAFGARSTLQGITRAGQSVSSEATDCAQAPRHSTRVQAPTRTAPHARLQHAIHPGSRVRACLKAPASVHTTDALETASVMPAHEHRVGRDVNNNSARCPTSALTTAMAMSSSLATSASSNAPYGKRSKSDSALHVAHPAIAGVKTSKTHPMNVSPLIPPELLPLYSRLMADVHANARADKGNGSHSIVPCPQSDLADMPIVHAEQRRSPLAASRTINISPTVGRLSSPHKMTSHDANKEQETAELHQPGECTQRSRCGDDRSGDQLHRPFVLRPSADLYSLTGPNAATELFRASLPLSRAMALPAGHGPPAAADGDLRLGNLVLSSCPGKKVRLSDSHLTHLGVPDVCKPGPMIDPRTGSAPSPNAVGQLLPLVAEAQANRSPICRDIELDLRRAMEMAEVRAVVCCLDDNELRFLGAAWPEYSRVAAHLGLEVIRLPMVEGFAPPSPEILDGHLSYLIRKYTLRGHSVLVHCRGGVGRAGLFACSWMVKLGLLGPVTGIHDPKGQDIEGEMRLVEKVISLIRRRRSAKAIETPQQVHFILQYVNWLSIHGQQLSAEQVLADSAGGEPGSHSPQTA